MKRRAWIVGQNEAAILGEGWYDRRAEWFGLPFRESCPRASLRLPEVADGDRVTLLLSSDLALHQGKQKVRVILADRAWDFEVRPPKPACGWQPFTIEAPRSAGDSSRSELVIESESWRHAAHEPIEDYREAGVLFAGVFVFSS